MTLPIEKNVPIPEKQKFGNRKFPFKELRVGDSFVVPLAKGKSPSSIYAAMSTAKKRLGIELTSARCDGGIRVWRIAAPQDARSNGAAE